MIKSFLIIIIVVGLAVAVAVFKKKSAIAPTNEPPTPSASLNVSPTPTPTASTVVKGQTITIVFAEGKANPANVSIQTGDTVKFINNDSVPHWPASGVHPTHQICPGFDSQRGLKAGESYSFTFRDVKTCPWHDHLKSSLNGQIEVN